MKSKHSLVMILCCIIPIALFLFFIARGVSPGSLLLVLVLLLCPALHYFMMKGMHGDKNHDNHGLHGSEGLPSIASINEQKLEEKPNLLWIPIKCKSVKSVASEFKSVVALEFIIYFMG